MILPSHSHWSSLSDNGGWLRENGSCLEKIGQCKETSGESTEIVWYQGRLLYYQWVIEREGKGRTHSYFSVSLSSVISLLRESHRPRSSLSSHRLFHCQIYYSYNSIKSIAFRSKLIDLLPSRKLLNLECKRLRKWSRYDILLRIILWMS